MRQFSSFTPGLLSLASLATLTQAELGKVYWKGPCGLTNATGISESAPMICGTLEVPLDYTDSHSTDTLTLDLAKWPATKKPAAEPILFNFGGPGINSFEGLALYGDEFQAILGGNNDLITFNPRGVGNTIPFACYISDASRNLASLQAPADGTASNTARGEIWAQSANIAQACYTLNNRTGSLIGTSFAARDTMQVLDALEGKHALLNYWGFSYGTTVGSVIAAMFPERMGHVALDGVDNPAEYLNGHNPYATEDADKVLQGFCLGCLAAPNLCPLAKMYNNATNLETAIYTILETLKFNPIPIPDQGGLVTYSDVKAIIYNALYVPSAWPMTSELIYYVQTRNTTVLGNPKVYKTLKSYGMSASLTSSSSEIHTGVTCSDKARQGSMKDVLPYIKKRASLSKIAGDGSSTDTRCAQWNKKMYAKERYTGDFNVKTAHPLLVLSNTYDPVTPLSAAKNLTATFEESVLLEQNGYGHTTLSMPSLCKAKAVRAYFKNGTLPADGTICQTDVPLFTNLTYADLWSKNFKRGVESVEDANVLKALMSVREKMSRRKLW
ncbi:alpha/beta hydrolase [Aspergillus alliaceus]|uniref:alpha/beta hydrolase n=1 Tax=Petromyces alliaceus TaxID=209559 RepID=UPI0012A72A4F|nr:TAP-like protein-domain-containing protein [Aspergillus alliaceus]KAB8235875.1 TAP-like protein-domain-containing protein [Aspergillus alliaceus]